MRIPIPKNKLVAFTLAGALLTAIIAGALAVPIPGVTASGDTGDGSGMVSTGAPQTAADAPTPNQDFTPAVQTPASYEDEEHEEHEEYEADEFEDDGEREEEHDDEHEGEDEEE